MYLARTIPQLRPPPPAKAIYDHGDLGVYAAPAMYPNCTNLAKGVPYSTLPLEIKTRARVTPGSFIPTKYFHGGGDLGVYATRTLCLKPAPPEWGVAIPTQPFRPLDCYIPPVPYPHAVSRAVLGLSVCTVGGLCFTPTNGPQGLRGTPLIPPLGMSTPHNAYMAGTRVYPPLGGCVSAVVKS